MKRILALIISVSLLLNLAAVMPALAARDEFVSEFGGTALEQGWRINGTTSGVTVAHNIAEGVVDFTSTQTSASEYTYYNTTSLRNTGFNFSGSGSIIISYDFAVKSYGTVSASGRLFDVCPEIYVGGVRQGLKEKHIPYVAYDGKLQGTNVAAELGKWYTAVCTIDTSSKLAVTEWYEQGGSTPIATSSVTGASYAADMEIRGIYITPLTNGSFSIDNFTVSTKNKLTITSPSQGSTAQTRTPLNITGTIPYDVTEAVITINGAEAARVDNSSGAETFSATVSIEDYSEGYYTISVEGGGYSHSVTVFFKEPFKNPLAITSPAEGSIVQVEQPLSITGTIPYDLAEADITIDGNKVASVDNSSKSDTFNASISIADYKEGNYTVGVEGGGSSHSVTLYFKEPPKEYGFKSVADGAMVARDEFDSVSLLAPEGEDITVLIDGEVISRYTAGEDEDIVTFPGLLSIGTHTIDAVWAGDKKSVDVSVIARDVTVNVNASMDNGVYDPFAYQEMAVGTDSEGKDVKAAPKSFTGADGTADGAFGFATNRAWTDTTLWKRSGPHLRLNTGSFGWNSGGMVRLEYDINLFARAYVEFEIKSSGEWGYIGEPIFTESGTIAKSTDMYPTNKWMHVEQLINIDSGTEDLIIDGKTYLSNSPVSYNLADITQMVLYYCPRNTKDAGLGFAVDNFVVTHEKPYYAFSDISCSADGTAFVPATGDELVGDTVALSINASEGLLAQGDITDRVSLTADGYAVGIASAEVAKDGMLTVKLASSLPEGAAIRLDIADEDGAALYTNSLTVADDGISIGNIAITGSGRPIYLADELSSLSSCTAEAEIKNNSSQPQSGVIIACAYSGTKLIAISSKTVSLAAGAASTESLDLTLREGAQDVSVKLFAIDSFTDRNAISGVRSFR